MHEEPPVFNYRVRAKGPEVRPGLVVAIEPMVVMGDQETYVKDDGWTVATEDGSAAAHWEHSVAVHADGIWVLTAQDGGAAGLARVRRDADAHPVTRSLARARRYYTPIGAIAPVSHKIDPWCLRHVSDVPFADQRTTSKPLLLATVRLWPKKTVSSRSKDP